MVGASKILTVSYGTFSCTLEGFDEPFSTMKAIAEYFRDLAAADRYFGAEPPTPDAEMLHRIAEREIQRRVEAKISENGVILRQSDAAPAEVPAVAPAIVAPVVAAPAAEAAPVAAPAHPEPAAVSAPAPEVVAPAAEVVAEAADADESESVAAKLMRIRAAVAAARGSESAAPAALAADDEEDAVNGFDSVAAEPLEGFGFEIELPDLHRADLAADLADDEAAIEEPRATAAEALAPEADITFDAPMAAEAEDVASDEDFDISAIEVAVAEEPAIADEEPAVLPEEAVVDLELLADLAADEPVAEDLPSEDISDEELADLEALDAQEPALTEADMIADLVAQAADAPAEEEVAFEAEDLTEDLTEDMADDAMAVMEEVAEAEEAEEDLPSEPYVLSSDLSAEDEPMLADDDQDEDWIGDLEAAVADEATEESIDETYEEEAPVAEVAAEDDFAEVAAEAEPEPEVVAAAPAKSGFLSRARARIIKVRQAASSQDDDEDEDGMPAAPSAAAPFEADLAAALVEEGESRRAMLEASEDASIESRLMEEAANKLEGAENRRKFSAISHLKAAVAATVADRKLKPKDAPAEPMFDEEDSIDRYRDDLSKAVRPRRPVGEPAAATRRPVIDSRPAPLVLVSEQRVDRPADLRKEGTVIRPRRITSGNLALTDDEDILDAENDLPLTPEEAQNFAEFADRMGATSLPDLLEAAAAYTASVEGRPYFSRPQILKKVAYVADDGDYSREDGLRSFGMLLRQGKIQKVRRGQFALAETSKFMTEDRRAVR